MGKDADKENLEAFTAFYRNYGDRLEKKVKAYNKKLAKDKNPLLATYKADLADLNDGGKLLRGVLVGLGYRLGGGEKGDYPLDLSLAFEMFQTGVLIHDDVIDNADLRRGKMTIHNRCLKRMEAQDITVVSARETEPSIARSVALCAGDLGLFYPNLILAESYADDPHFGEISAEFSRIVIDTIRGEMLDVVLPYQLQDSSYTDEERGKLLEKSVADIYHLKTARYSVVGPLHLGLMLAGGSEKLIRRIDSFADDIGVAYQIMDDVLGIYADEALLGKDVGSDILEYKQTILYMYVRNYAPDYAGRLERHYGSPNVTEQDVEKVQDIFRESGALTYAQDAMNSCFARAERKLARMDLSKEDKQVLKGFISWCRGRRK